jgi:molecular chaperone GrpE (heat shock protein)
VEAPNDHQPLVLYLQGATDKEDNRSPGATDIHRIEKLTNELMELEKRVQRSTDDSENYLVSLHCSKLYLLYLYFISMR